jgi:hypothetical protein
LFMLDLIWTELTCDESIFKSIIDWMQCRWGRGALILNLQSRDGEKQCIVSKQKYRTGGIVSVLLSS